MAFNMGAFLGGAATGLVDRIEDDERKAEKKADIDDQRAYTKSEEARLYKRGIRDAKQAKTNALAAKLAVFYPPAIAQDIMSNGNGAAQYAITQGKLYKDNGMDPALQYTLPGNDIKGKTSSSETPVSGSSIDKLTGESSATPEGLSFSSRFKGVSSRRKYKTLANMKMGLINETIEAQGDPALLQDIEARTEIYLDMAEREANAERKNDKDTNFFTNIERSTYVNEERKQSRNFLNIETGVQDQIVGGVEGSNKDLMAEVMTAGRLKIYNTRVSKDDNLTATIDTIVETSTIQLNDYARKNARSKIEFGYQSDRELKAAVQKGNLQFGDLYVVKTKIKTGKFVDGIEQIVEAFTAGTYIGNNYADVMGADDGFLTVRTSYAPTVNFEPFPSGYTRPDNATRQKN